MRVDLGDGQYAVLRERITHAQDKELKRAVQRAKDDPLDKFDVATVLVREFTREWHVLDLDGAAIPLTDADAIDRAPDNIVETLSEQAAGLWTGATVPNPSTPPSSDAGSSAA